MTVLSRANVSIFFSYANKKLMNGFWWNLRVVITTCSVYHQQKNWLQFEQKCTGDKEAGYDKNLNWRQTGAAMQQMTS